MSEVAAAEACVAWAVSRGTQFENVSLTYRSDRGVCITKSCSSPARIVVPAGILLTLRTIEAFAATEPAFAALLAEWSFRVKLTHKRAVLLLLCFDARHGSPWSRYIASLPTRVDSPAWWSADELRLLQGTSIEGVCEERRAFTTAWLGVQQRRPEASALTLDISVDELLEYLLLIDSRALLSKEDDAVMVPVADFCNHSSARLGPDAQNSVWEHDAATGAFVLAELPGLNLAEGTELLFSYGKRGAGEFLVNYGFIEDGVGLEDVPSRCMTLDLSWLAVERPQLKQLPFMPGLKLHSDIAPIATDDTGYVWWTIDVDGLDLPTLTLHGEPVTNTTLRGRVEKQERWREYERQALQVAQAAIERAVQALDAAEADATLREIAEKARPEVLDTADRVRDAERALLMLNWRIIDEKLSGD